MLSTKNNICRIIDENECHFRFLEKSCLGTDESMIEDYIDKLTDMFIDIVNMSSGGYSKVILLGVGNGKILLLLSFLYPNADIICFIGRNNNEKVVDYARSLNGNIVAIGGDPVSSVSSYVKDNPSTVQLVIHNTFLKCMERNLQFFLSHDLCEQNSVISFANTHLSNHSLIDGYQDSGLVRVACKSYMHTIVTIDKPALSIAICTNPCSDDISYSYESKQKYCNRYGYILEPVGFEFFGELLERKDGDNHVYDYVLWLPSSTYIMNPGIRLSSFLRGTKPRDVTVDSSGSVGFDSVFAVKNTGWSRNLFLEGQDIKSVNEEHITPDIRVPFSGLSGYDPETCLGLHLTEYPLNRFQTNPYCPVRMDSETEEAYQARLRWIFNASKSYTKWRVRKNELLKKCIGVD